MDIPRNPDAAERPIQIAPSVLPADFARLGDEVAALEKAGVDRIQWDVMDGRFVPNLTFGPDVIAACRPHAAIPFEAHLMVEEPDELMGRYVEAGCSLLLVHAESTRHLHRSLGRVRELGAQAAVALNPATPAESIVNVLDLCAMVLVMTVNPGFGGQDYIATMEPKITQIRRMIVD
ncbi:MAG: ribulose-phosphate 3-epimerase, partial [Acidimicrobiales bacterium]|nr:ribulose-phosphate 3-epimerase [Acidimicrobiales bacterium]